MAQLRAMLDKPVVRGKILVLAGDGSFAIARHWQPFPSQPPQRAKSRIFYAVVKKQVEYDQSDHLAPTGSGTATAVRS
jgi:hypothetical protein